MNIGIWLGFAAGAALVAWGVQEAGAGAILFDRHAIVIVLGGTAAAALVLSPLANLWSALRRFMGLFLPQAAPAPEACIDEVVRLARRAHQGGGLLALHREGGDFADGFLRHAILVAIATGESAETRRILEAEVHNIRAEHQEDANIFRTLGLLAPMFGILGTLLGMIRVLSTLSDPSRMAPFMALALSSAFLGIGLANLICVPVASQIRLRAMREVLALEILLEGILDIVIGKAPYSIELHLSSYSRRRRAAMEARDAEPAVAPAGE